MLGLFKQVEPYLKTKRKIDVPRPDNLVFKLHYKVQSILDLAKILGSILLNQILNIFVFEKYETIRTFSHNFNNGNTFRLSTF